jgi:hypothetical protein
MAEYKGIKGFKVQTVSTDPAASAIAGGTWASGGNLNTARDLLGGAGSQTSSLVFGGEPYPSVSALTEAYNGSSWTEVSDLNTARFLLGGVGADNTAVLAFGGDPGYKANTESWDGTSWTEVADLNTGRWSMAGNSGIQSAALLFGGATSPSTVANTESWNGSSWTEVADLNTAREENAGAGTYTAALSIAGTPSYPTATAVVEEWNGSSWTEITDVNTARNNLGGLKGGGTVTDALVFGGLNRATPAIYTNTESWNGSSWTEVADLSIARHSLSGSGSSSAALAAGGLTSTAVTAATEEWTAPALFSKENLGQVFYNSTSNAFKVTKQSVPAGTWASGADFNTARHSTGGFGLNNSDSLMAGGYAPPGTPSTATEKYDGTSWTTDPATLNTSRYDAVGFGTSKEAGIVVGGYATTLLGVNESYNGTSWTEIADLNTARSASSGGGTQTSAIYALGYSGSYPNSTASESWNGTSWTTTSSANTGRAGSSGAGTSNTSVLVFGGDTYDGTPGSIPTRASSASEFWNGTSWTATPSLNTGAFDGGGFGTATSAIKFGGANSPGILANTEFYNGTSWTELNDLGIAARYVNLGTVGTSISGLQAGGSTPASSYSVTTQEWAAGTANSTLTAS